MFTNTLSPNTLRGIKLIGNEKWLNFAYLAGGTALALRLGHRKSLDLDFFTPEKFDEQIILNKLQETGQYKVRQTAWQTVKGRLFEISFSLFYYKYPIQDQTDDFLGINIASLKDIAAMKINAIEGRGSKRDFIDLYFLSQNFSLEEMLEFYDLKYDCLKEHKYSILKSLNYFEDAESENPPQMIKEIDWNKIKDFFQKESKRLSSDLI